MPNYPKNTLMSVLYAIFDFVPGMDARLPKHKSNKTIICKNKIA